MLAHLTGSGLVAADARLLGIRPVTAAQAEKLVGQARAGYIIPYYDLAGKKTHFYRVRFLEEAAGFGAKDAPKYMQPGKTPPRVYLARTYAKGWKTALTDPSVPLWITEGEKKAAAVCKVDVACIGIGGVWSFRSRKLHEVLIADMREIAWRDRRVFLAYDSDAATNDDVMAAERELARTLTREGALVSVIRVPSRPGGDKVGLDDYLVEHGPEALLELQNEATIDDPVQQMLWDMQAHITFVKDPGLIVNVINGQRLSTSQFLKSNFSHWCVEQLGARGGTKTVRVAEKWMEWGARREHDKFVFAPGQPRHCGRNLNLWESWGCAPKRGSIEPFTAYMQRLFDGLSKDELRWVYKWLAYPIQHPGSKMHSGLYVWGREQGTGKSTLGYVMKPIYGPHWMELSSDQLDLSFNGWAVRTTFALADDIVSGDTGAKFRDRLKPLITRTTIAVNEKYEKPFVVTDRVNYLFTANHPDSLRLEADDRRFFVHEVTSDRWPAAEAKAFYQWLEGPGAPAIFYYFLHFDLGDFNPKAPPPLTEAKRAVIESNRGDLERLVDRLVKDHKTGHSGMHPQCDLFTAEQIQAHFANRDTLARPPSTRAIASILQQHGGIRRLGEVKMAKGRQRVLFAIRNADRWADPRAAQKAAAHWEQYFSGLATA